MAKKKKGKGFFSAIGSALGSIPVVGKVKKASKTVKKKVKSAKKKLKKTVKKVKKKVKKKIGKVYTKARKIKNNLSKKKIVKKVKKAVKKAVLATKKAAKKVKSTAKKAAKTVKKATKAATKQVKKTAKKAVTKAKQNVKTAIKDTKKVMTKVGGKVAVAYTSFKEGGYKGVISAGLDFIPIVGNAKALVEAAIGRDPITGRKLESWERGASAAAILGGPLVKGVKHGAKLGAKAISGATSSTKAKTKTVNLAKSPTPSNPPKQQAPSQAKKEASATTATPAKAKQNTKGTGKSLDSVPSVRNGEFSNWFNSLTTEEFDRVWSDPKLREKIKDRLRHPGGMHEWHLVSRADTFKYWGVTSEQIAEMRTLISDTKFVNPAGKHGGKGSTKAHNELLQIIDTSEDYDMFKRRLQNWSDYRFEGGSDALPDGLKPNRR
jgi:chemotaxis protein histidine kinase CheA